MTARERRGAARVRRRLRITIRTPDGTASGVCRNVSARGLSIELGAPLRLDSRVAVTILLPEGRRAELESVVRWSHPSAHGAVVGLEIVGRPDARYAALVRDEIAAIQARSEAAADGPRLTATRTPPRPGRRMPSPPALGGSSATPRRRSSGKTARVKTPRQAPADPLARLVRRDGLASATVRGERLELLELVALVREAALQALDGVGAATVASVGVDVLDPEVGDGAALAAVARVVSVDRAARRVRLEAELAVGRRVVARAHLEMVIAPR